MHENDSQKIVFLTSASGETNAYILKNKLEAFGIPCMLKQSKGNIPYTAYGVMGIDLMVKESDLVEAKSIIFEQSISEENDTDYSDFLQDMEGM